MSSLFSLPLSAYYQPSTVGDREQKNAKKRKRKARSDRSPGTQLEENPTQANSFGSQPQSSQNLEYLAVLTPEQRTQYRLAGQVFDEEPPAFPFPHSAVAPPPRPRDNEWSRSRSGATKKVYQSKPLQTTSRAPTLHIQHFSAITAVLHRCLMEQDFTRASRAMGLILRDSIGGHSIDIRSEGHWGIGAEILLRSDRQLRGSDGQDTSENRPLFTREGFEKAKQYYQRLVIQYPYHKQHAASVNALDFYQALFGLWIYIAHEQSKSEVDASLTESLLTAQQRELEQAREIASRMDACMTGVPFNDDLELIRLRGMLALWIADLIDATAAFPSHTANGDIMRGDNSAMDDITADVNHIALEEGSHRVSRGGSGVEAAQSRRIAQQMFARLRGDAASEDY